MRDLPEILKGCKVFPCVPNGKLPATSNGWRDASDDPAQIAEWLRVNPDFNWAVATGLSGLFVIDVDPAGLDWWAKLLERDEVIREAVARAYQVRTPRGGLHIYFRGEGPSTASRIADGIDTRGGMWRAGKLVSGGYVLLPGSKTPAGAYSELPGGAINPTPAEIVALVPERKKTDTLGLAKNPDHDQPRNVQWAVDLLKGYVTSGRVSISGAGGNDLAWRVAASVLDKAISPGMCYDLLWEHWNPACVPPWDEHELDTIILNALEHGEDTKTGAKGILSNTDAFAAFEGQEYEAPEPLVRRSRFKPMWLHEARKDVREATWLIPGLVPSDGAGVLYGLSGSYKTFIVLDWALCLAYGVAGQWGAPPVKHTVLFLAGESSYALRQERVNAWCEKHGQDPDDETVKFIMVPGVPAYGDTEGWQEIREGLAEMGVRPDFIAIDTLTRMLTGLDENSNNDGKLILKHCEEMAAHYGAFVIGIGHTGKDQARGLRGAQAMIDNSEVVHMTKKTETGTSLRVVKLKEVDIPSELFYFQVEKLAKSIVLTRTENVPVEMAANKSKYSWSSLPEVTKVLNALGGKTTTAILAQTIAGSLGIDRDVVKKQLALATDLASIHPDRDTWEIAKMEFDL